MYIKQYYRFNENLIIVHIFIALRSVGMRKNIIISQLIISILELSLFYTCKVESQNFLDPVLAKPES